MRIVDEFQRQHPDIKVRPILSAPGVMQQLSTFCAGGKCPDVLMAWELTYAELADRGVLLDLNPLLARDPAFAAQLKSDSVGPLYDTFAFNGGQYAFPEQWSGNYLFYNRKLFADAGRAAAARPPGSRPWSFRRIPRHRGRSDQAERIGTGQPVGLRQHLRLVLLRRGLFAMNNGVPWSTPRMNPTHFNFDDDAFIEAVQFYVDLANKYGRRRTRPRCSRCPRPTCSRSARPAMALGGHWRYQTFMRAPAWISMSRRCRSGRGEQGHPACSNIGVTGLAIAAEQPAQGAGMGIREVRDRPRRAGVDR